MMMMNLDEKPHDDSYMILRVSYELEEGHSSSQCPTSRSKI